MVGQRNVGRGVGGRGVLKGQLVAAGRRRRPQVGRPGGDVSGEPVVTVRRFDDERHADAVVPLDGSLLPPALACPVARSAVQDVLALVGGQFVPGAVDRERRPADAVGVPADGAAEIRMVGEVAVDRIEGEIDVRQFAVPVGNVDVHQGRREVGQVHVGSVGGRQHVSINLGAVVEFSERLFFDRHTGGGGGGVEV